MRERNIKRIRQLKSIYRVIKSKLINNMRVNNFQFVKQIEIDFYLKQIYYIYFIVSEF